MGIVSKLTSHGERFVESVARKLGFETAEHAEQMMGAKAFGNAVDREAAAGPREVQEFAPRTKEKFSPDAEETGLVPSPSSETPSERYTADQERRKKLKEDFKATPTEESPREGLVPTETETSADRYAADQAKRNFLKREEPSLREGMEEPQLFDISEVNGVGSKEGASWPGLDKSNFKKAGLGAAALGGTAYASEAGVPADEEESSLRKLKDRGPPAPANSPVMEDSKPASEAPVASTPHEAAVDAASVFARVGSARKTESPATPTQDDPKESESALRYQDWKEANSRLQTAAQATQDPSVRKVYLDAQKEARQLYDENADRNAWLSVAERIGTSLIRLNAASKGQKHHVNLSNPALDKPIDWDSKTGQEQKNYINELDRLRGNYKESQTEFEQGKDDKTKALGSDADMQKYRYGQAEQGEREDKRLAVSERNAARRQASSEAAADRRADKTDRNQQDREDRFNRTQLLKDVGAKEQEESRKTAAAQQLVNNLKMESDISPKARERLQQKYGQLAAQADVDLGELTESLKSKDTGWFGDSKESDQKEKNKILDGIVAQHKNMLDAIREKKQSLLANPATTPAGTGPAPAATSTPAPIQEPTEEQIKKYVGLYPQVSVDQARDILKKRMQAGGK